MGLAVTGNFCNLSAITPMKYREEEKKLSSQITPPQSAARSPAWAEAHQDRSPTDAIYSERRKIKDV